MVVRLTRHLSSVLVAGLALVNVRFSIRLVMQRVTHVDLFPLFESSFRPRSTCPPQSPSSTKIGAATSGPARVRAALCPCFPLFPLFDFFQFFHNSPPPPPSTVALVLLRAGLGIDLRTVQSYGFAIPTMAILPSVCESLLGAAVAQALIGMPFLLAWVMSFIISAVGPAIVTAGCSSVKERGFAPAAPNFLMTCSCFDDATVRPPILVVPIYTIPPPPP